MKKEDELLELVRSLQPNEKRYFKLHAHKHVISGYKANSEKLFDAICKYSPALYDEKDFRSANRGKPFLKNLSDEKKELYNLILGTMRSYNAEKDDVTTFYELLLDIRFLIAKGLKTKAHALIDKAFDIAEAQQLYPEMLVLNDYLTSLYPISSAQAPYTAASIVEHEKKVANSISVERKAAQLKAHLFEIDAADSWKENKKQVDAIMKQVNELIPHVTVSRKAEIFVLNMRQLYMMRNHEYEKCFTMSKEWLEKLPEDELLKKYSHRQLRISLCNLLMLAFKCERFEIFPETIEKLKNLVTDNKTEEAEIFRNVTQYELIYLLNTHNFKNCDTLLAEIDHGLTKYKHFVSERMRIQFRYNLALLEYFRKNYDEALHHLQTLFYEAGRDKKYTYIVTLSKVVEWLCQAATNNFDVLDSMLRNLNKYLADRNLKDDFFEHLMVIFKTILAENKMRSPKVSALVKKLSEVKYSPEWEQLIGITEFVILQYLPPRKQ